MKTIRAPKCFRCGWTMRPDRDVYPSAIVIDGRIFLELSSPDGDPVAFKCYGCGALEVAGQLLVAAGGRVG